MASKELPGKLYKYAAFNTNSLRLLSEGEVFYSNPKRFNDPLDCNPTIQIDAEGESAKSVEKLLWHMTTDAPDYVGSPDDNREKKFNAIRTTCMDGASYFYDGDDIVSVDDPVKRKKRYINNLASSIKRLLDLEMEKKGVLALAEAWDSPLMWSHYADEHRGICIEYDMASNLCPQIKAVSYESQRAVKISDLISWKINQSAIAEQNVIDTYFFAKSGEWGYEKEWRDVSNSNGVKSAPIRISGVYFGLRCDSSVIRCIVKLLQKYAYSENLDFYQIIPHEYDFSLKRYSVDVDEINGCSVGSSAMIDFRVLP